MSGKSKHGHRKLSRSKRKAGKQIVSAVKVQQQAIAMPVESTSRPERADSSASRTSVAAPPMPRYPYITAELRRIGILSGIILVVLVILAFALS